MQDMHTTGVAPANMTEGLGVVIDPTVSNGVKLPAADTDFILGITAIPAENGQSISIQHAGIAWVFAGADVTRGQSVKINTAGKAVSTTTGSAFGKVLEGAKAGEKARVFISRHVAG